MTKHTHISFSPDELRPHTGLPRPDLSPERRTGLRGWNERLRSIYVQNPNHTAVFTALDEVMALGGDGGRQYAVRNSAPSFAGKSAAADEFARIVTARGEAGPGDIPVLRVELEQACTSRRFWTAINAALGDGFAGRKDEEQLRLSAYDAFERFGTRLLVLDEVQHVGYRSSGSSAASDVLKRFINDGKVAIGLFGNEDAKPLLENNIQLSHRLLSPCDIQPLRIAEPGDRKRFTNFLRKYDDQLAAKSVFRRNSGLSEERIAHCLMHLSKGFLGRVVATLHIAASHAYRRDADHIEVHDLSYAATTWAVAQKLTPHDPFRFGRDAAS